MILIWWFMEINDKKDKLNSENTNAELQNWEPPKLILLSPNAIMGGPSGSSEPDGYKGFS